MRSPTPRRPLVAALLGLAMAAATAVGTIPPAVAAPSPTTWLLTTQPGTTAGVAAQLRRDGVPVLRELTAAGVLSVSATDEQAARWRSDPRVTGVSADRSTTLQADAWSPTTNAGSLYQVSLSTGARSAWGASTGRGVDVALLDSGVTPVTGLDGPGKLVQGPDLSFDSQVPGLRSLDGFGHGTHLAGIIAGRDASFTGPRDTDSFAGIAPDARVISVKVADAFGNADVSQIIAGIDWVVEHRTDAGMNIRVLNLSVGLPSRNAYREDPLAHAAEQAWRAGIVVVASAGNNAKDDGQLLSPAYDPLLLAVGASDSRGTVDTRDDTVPDFSSKGTWLRTPDLIAPGRSIASLRVPGSYLDQQYGGAAIGGRYFRGSGTSQSAAIVSGTAALLLQRRPGLHPDQVKEVLLNTARQLVLTSTTAQGRGQLRASDAIMLLPSVVAQPATRSTGTGSLDNARGGYVVESGGVALTGDRDVFGQPFSPVAHAAAAGAGTAWTGGSWNGTTMTGTALTATGWSSVLWAGNDWAGLSWAARGSSGASWDGRSWAGGYWNGRSWAGRSWAGRSWASGSWD